MKTRKVTEKFDSDGKLIERTVEETETIELAPINPTPVILPINPYPFQYPQIWSTIQPSPTCVPNTVTITGNIC